MQHAIHNVNIDRQRQMGPVLLGSRQRQHGNGPRSIKAAKVVGGQVGPKVNVM
jgi:hypothetical protein